MQTSTIPSQLHALGFMVCQTVLKRYTFEVVEVNMTWLLNSPLDGVECSASHSGRFIPADISPGDHD